MQHEAAPEVKQDSLETLKQNYLGLCQQLGEKNLHLALMTQEAVDLTEKLKGIAKDLYASMQAPAAPASPAAEVDGVAV